MTADMKQVLIRRSKHDRVKRLALDQEQDVRDVYKNILVTIAAEPAAEVEEVVKAKPIVSDAVWDMVRKRAKQERVSIPVLIERQIDKLGGR